MNDKELQIALVLFELTQQVKAFSDQEKEADYTLVAENLKHYGLYPRLCIKYWEAARKKFFDSSKSNFSLTLGSEAI